MSPASTCGLAGLPYRAISSYTHGRAAYGTIGAMSCHRVRLTDEELSEITAALRARLAMRKGRGRLAAERLLARLEDCAPGNPHLQVGGLCVHGIALTDRCEACRARNRQILQAAADAAAVASQRPGL